MQKQFANLVSWEWKRMYLPNTPLKDSKLCFHFIGTVYQFINCALSTHSRAHTYTQEQCQTVNLNFRPCLAQLSKEPTANTIQVVKQFLALYK